MADHLVDLGPHAGSQGGQVMLPEVPEERKSFESPS
jgi:excinuclease UvrABC ATPase subunit